RIDLPGGYRLSLHLDTTSYPEAVQAIVIEQNNQPLAPISVQDILAQWLKEDKLWGDHEEANRLRGIHHHGGLSGVIFDVTPVGQSVLAVISWVATSGSGNAVEAQQLVRIGVDPKPTITALRSLELPSDFEIEWMYGLSPDPCRRLLA